MSGDLTELNSRLRPSGQAGVLAQRLEKGVGKPSLERWRIRQSWILWSINCFHLPLQMSALVEICKSVSTDAYCLHDLQADYDPLLKRIIELATQDTQKNATADQRFVLHETSHASSILVKPCPRIGKLLSVKSAQHLVTFRRYYFALGNGWKSASGVKSSPALLLWLAQRLLQREWTYVLSRMSGMASIVDIIQCCAR